METFYELQAWLADCMTDTSDTAPFNDSPSAEFYRKLAVNQPYLIDYLLQANPDQVSQFKQVVHQLGLYVSLMSCLGIAIHCALGTHDSDPCGDDAGSLLEVK